MNRLYLLLFNLISGFTYVFSLMPRSLRNAVAKVLYFKIYYLFRYRKKVVRENLRLSFPDQSKEEQIRIEKNFYRHFSRLLLEINAGQSISENEMRNAFRYKNPELLLHYLNQGKSIILVFGHYGNWEWSISLPLVLNYPVLGVYQPLTNAYMDQKMKKIRNRFGMIPIPMQHIYKELVQRQKEGRPAVSYFIADQSPNRSQIKEYFRFLNQPTGVFQGAERIARKLNQVVIYMNIKPLEGGVYESDFELLVENPADCSENEITLKHLDKLEKLIENAPEFWLWTHKRWKHKPLPGDKILN